MIRDLTKGKPVRLIISFCLPLMLGQLFQQFYNMVDSIIVGRFAGTPELSAVGSTGSLSFLVVGFVCGFTTGLSIPISRAFGEGDHQKVRRLYINSIYLTGLATAVLTTLTYFLTPSVLRLMNTPEEIFSMAYDYIGTVFLGLIAILFYNLFACVMRALGDSKTPLLLLIFSSLLNIALDLFFVIKLKMACKGVAIATVIAQLISALLAFFIILKRYDILRLNKEDFRPRPALCGNLLYNGLPMALQLSVTAIGAVMLQSAVNALGEISIAAVTVASKIQLFLVLPAESIGLTMATYCGQNLGAGKYQRIKEGLLKALIMSGVYSAVIMLVAYFFAGDLAVLFVTSDQTEVILLVEKFLHICLIFYPVLAVLFPLRNSVQGLGYSLPALLAGVFELAARSIMGLIVIPRVGYTAVCFANPAAWIAADALLLPVLLFVLHRTKKALENRLPRAEAPI
ncbi:MAG: MATE family efflux transporter [Clostridiales bacterium]|nr:MATE family efflux transporter [Clostridiales bacterium]